MMIYHQEDKHPYIRLDVYIQADMRMLRFKLQDYIASFSIIMKFKGKLAPLYGKQGERMLTRIHRDNPQALSISKLPTNPYVLSHI